MSVKCQQQASTVGEIIRLQRLKEYDRNTEVFDPEESVPTPEERAGFAPPIPERCPPYQSPASERSWRRERARSKIGDPPEWSQFYSSLLSQTGGDYVAAVAGLKEAFPIACQSPKWQSYIERFVRCEKCVSCTKLQQWSIARQCGLEAAFHDATYMVTLTVPPSVDTEYFRRKMVPNFLEAVSRASRRQGGNIAYFKALEPHKKREDHWHAHILLNISFGNGKEYDPVHMRELWRPYIIDIRLVCGNGRDLDGHIKAGRSAGYNMHNRVLHDAKVPWENRLQRPDGKTAMDAVYYCTKYLGKRPVQDKHGKMVWRNNHRCSRGHGDPAKALVIAARHYGRNVSLVDAKQMILDLSNPAGDHCDMGDLFVNKCRKKLRLQPAMQLGLELLGATRPNMSPEHQKKVNFFLSTCSRILNRDAVVEASRKSHAKEYRSDEVPL